MAKKKVTSSDVARASGVSQATVSMILNHKSTVSFTRETVGKGGAGRPEKWDTRFRDAGPIRTAGASG